MRWSMRGVRSSIFIFSLLARENLVWVAKHSNYISCRRLTVQALPLSSGDRRDNA